MAMALDLRVIAEGIETEQQLDLLGHLCCDEAQGYLFSKPLPLGDARELLVGSKHLLRVQAS
jgi:EAL domain-containing protein (putative c-di-GMP-specific phosphodiesterase class I)